MTSSTSCSTTNKAAIVGMLKPIYKENVIGRAEGAADPFHVPR